MNLGEITDGIEAVSKIYADRHGIARSPEWFVLKLQEEVGELTQAFLMKTGQGRSKGRDAAELDAMQRAVEEKWLVWNRVSAEQSGGL